MNHPDEELDAFEFELDQEEYTDDFADLTDKQIDELYFIDEANKLPVDPILGRKTIMGYANQHAAVDQSTHSNGQKNLFSANENGKKLSQLNGTTGEKSQLFVTKFDSVIVNPDGEKPSSKGFYMLSNLDQMYPFLIEVIFAYENKYINVDVSDVLKKSLSKVLEEYYPLAGGLDMSWDGNMFVDCNGGHGGIPFVEAFCDEDMASAAGDITKIDDKLAQFAYSKEKPYATILDVPPLSVQVTKFKCGGIILGVGFNHAVIDGQAFSDFMISWSQVARGLPSAHPHLDRSILAPRNPPQISGAHHEFTKSKNTLPLSGPKDEQQTIMQKSFTFTVAKMSQLKKLAMPNNSPNIPTGFEVLTAVIWVCWTKAMEIDPQNTTQILSVVDGRYKFQPPLPKPYFGNGIALACARSKTSDLTSEPLSYAVQLVQESIKGVTEDHMRSTIDYREVKRKPVEHVNTLWITKWSRIPFYEVDFSWGGPKKAGPATLLDNLVVLLAEEKDARTLIVSISLPAKAMKIFEEQMESIMN